MGLFITTCGKLEGGRRFLMSEVPLYTKYPSDQPSASERIGNNLKCLNHFYLQDKAKIWLSLSHMSFFTLGVGLSPAL